MSNSKQHAILLTLSLLLLTANASASTSTDKRKHSSPHQLTRSGAKEAEQRLSDMGYSTGRVDGIIDGTTRNGLIVFQKWEGRKAYLSLALYALAVPLAYWHPFIAAGNLVLGTLLWIVPGFMLPNPHH